MENIGAKVKALRLENKMTLKDLGKLSKLSIGFLSQFERDQTTIAIDSLSRIAKIFDVDITYLLGVNQNHHPQLLENMIMLMCKY